MIILEFLNNHLYQKSILFNYMYFFEKFYTYIYFKAVNFLHISSMLTKVNVLITK